MLKRTDFGEYEHKGWPAPKTLSRFFLAPPGQEWFNYWGNDTAALSIEGLYGTENEDHLAGKRVDLDLYLYGMPGLGVLLIYHKHGGGYQEEYTSVGDLSRLNEWVENLHRTKLPIGLFIPFPRAYDAVKEFIETDGELPKCIEWVANKDLPYGTFPDPAVELEERFGKG
ncbi:Imm1 family immunity protein [Methyloceanibacter caenitepidi]|uniref:Imm1 family immunity protein n=1 Tax=Methyloceanibacter caenitepidi TaxID=1384459 RepID=UPI0005EDDBCB|nr:Imm1 family immunity protein [Methyloceanibacter caenitepidi]